MANKKFRRMITGILLSCNLISFPFCSAYDVLTETVANQSGSEFLNALCKVGAILQGYYQQNLSNEPKAIDESNALYNQSIKELDDLRAFYEELFKDCCDLEKLKKLKNDFINDITTEIKVLLSTADELDYADVYYYAGRRFWSDPRFKFMHLLYITNKLPESVVVVKPLPIKYKITDLKTVNALFQLQPALTLLQTLNSYQTVIERTTSLTKSTPDKPEIETIYTLGVSKSLSEQTQRDKMEMYIRTMLNSTTSEKKCFYGLIGKLPSVTVTALEKIPELPESKEWRTQIDNLRRELAKKIFPTNSKDGNETAITELLQPLKTQIIDTIDKEKQLLDRGREFILECLKNDYLTKYQRTDKSYPENQTKIVSSITPHLARLPQKPAGKIHYRISEHNYPAEIYSYLGRIFPLASASQANRKYCKLNSHLESHFQQEPDKDVKQGKPITGKYDAKGSIFQDCTAFSALAKLTATKVTPILSFEYPVNYGDSVRNNTVCFIYDCENKGFAKTGEVYRKTTGSWESTYALMLVTDTDDTVITSYPLYI